MNLQQLLDIVGLKDDEVLNVYQYGSRIYGTETEESDWDFTIVVQDSITRSEQFNVENVDSNIFTQSRFLDLIEMQDVRTLISIFLPSEYVWKKTVDFETYFELNPEKLRISFSALSHKAYGCSKIQFLKENNIKKGKKDFISSFRYLSFGIQILSNEKILDYKAANSLHFEIMADPVTDWTEFDKRYKPYTNELGNQFRSMLPEKQHTERHKQRRSRKNKMTPGKTMYFNLGLAANSLPTNVIARILRFVGDVTAARKVNRKWRDTVDNHFLNK